MQGRGHQERGRKEIESSGFKKVGEEKLLMENYVQRAVSVVRDRQGRARNVERLPKVNSVSVGDPRPVLDGSSGSVRHRFGVGRPERLVAAGPFSSAKSETPRWSANDQQRVAPPNCWGTGVTARRTARTYSAANRARRPKNVLHLTQAVTQPILKMVQRSFRRNAPRRSFHLGWLADLVSLA